MQQRINNGETTAIRNLEYIISSTSCNGELQLFQDHANPNNLHAIDRSKPPRICSNPFLRRPNNVTFPTTWKYPFKSWAIFILFLQTTLTILPTPSNGNHAIQNNSAKQSHAVSLKNQSQIYITLKSKLNPPLHWSNPKPDSNFIEKMNLIKPIILCSKSSAFHCTLFLRSLHFTCYHLLSKNS